jgi:hypothetical protein
MYPPTQSARAVAMQELAAVKELVAAEMLPHSRQTLLCSYWNRNKCMCRPMTNSMTKNDRFGSSWCHMPCHTRLSSSGKQVEEKAEEMTPLAVVTAKVEETRPVAAMKLNQRIKSTRQIRNRLHGW